MSSAGIDTVDAYTAAVKQSLDRARDVKPLGYIDPALTIPDFNGGIERIGSLYSGTTSISYQNHYAAIETAFRNIFYDLLVMDRRYRDCGWC